MNKVIFILSIVFLVSTGSVVAQETGNPAPDFTLNTLDGGSFTLSEQTGKLVVIFTLGYSCPYCISSGPVIQEHLVDAYKENDDYVVIGIDIWDGSVGAVTTFKNNTNMDIPLLLNGSGFATTYNTVQDRLYVIDKQGILIYRGNSGAINDYKDVVPIVNEYLDVISSVKNADSDEFSLKVYPNPVTENEVNLAFNLSETGFVNAKVIGTDGRTILQSVSKIFSRGANTLTFDTGNLTSGVYFVVLRIDDKQIYRKILVD